MTSRREYFPDSISTTLTMNLLYSARTPMSMVDIIKKARGLLVNPTATFRKSRTDSIGDALVYYIVILLIYAIFSTILAFAGLSPFLPFQRMGGAGLFLVSGVISTVIFGIIAALVAGVILHIFVLIVGGRKGIGQTIKAVMYGNTPVLLIGWIPLIGIIGLIYGLVLEVIGIRELHGISTIRAVIAVFMPAILVFLLMLLFFAALLLSVLGSSIPGLFEAVTIGMAP